MSVARRRSRPVFLELVPELAEAHAQELRSARLHAGRPREGHLDVALLDLVERRLEVEPAFRNLDGNVLDVAGTAQIGRQRVRVQRLAAAEDERALDHVLELPGVRGRPGVPAPPDLPGSRGIFLDEGRPESGMSSGRSRSGGMWMGITLS